MTVLRLHTSDGVDLAAETAGSDGAPRAAAVLLHPHPKMGGDMRTPVPDHLFRTLPASGIEVLRFDFRGAGGSGGSHGGGGPEVADAEAAVAELSGLTSLPVWLVGWSFGADVSLRVTDTAVAGWVPVAPPLQQPGIDASGGDPRPAHLLVPEHDQFCSPGRAERVTAGWESTTVERIPGADHFLAGRLGALTDLVVGALTGDRHASSDRGGEGQASRPV